jgi:hypothetical protein
MQRTAIFFITAFTLLVSASEFGSNGGSRIAMPTFSDLVNFGCSPTSRMFFIKHIRVVELSFGNTSVPQQPGAGQNS